ncbi:MAG: hypothetical protein QOH81_1551 [Sphingomonadales bacterium]|jgi:hypothetical protein|nr:hypothetical protein [Sphingomonadales bacterium]
MSDNEDGIDYEYRSLLARVDRLLPSLESYPESNDTPEGRVKGILKWLREQVDARKLPIPLDRSWWGSLDYFASSGELASIPGAEKALSEISLILDGEGLVRPDDYPDVRRLLARFLLAYDEAVRPHITEGQSKFRDELEKIEGQIENEEISLPLDEEGFVERHPPSEWMEPLMEDLALSQEQTQLFFSLFAGARPRRRNDLPLRAPNPGLPDQAPPFEE